MIIFKEAPPCRLCCTNEYVFQYEEDKPEKAICVFCCEKAEHDDGETGHVFVYDPAERDRVCNYCGQFARNTDYYDGWGEP